MNAGLSNFDTLKKQVLAGALGAKDTRFDLTLQGIGIGMARRIETFLNRRLMRVVGDVEILAADRANFLLRRYPLEVLTQIQLNLADGNGWVVQDPTTFYNSIDMLAGIVMCPDQADAGPYYAQVQFTYTGGFFWEQNEPNTPDYPTQQPAGSFCLPEDIQLAWLMQCQHVWSKRDKLGLSIADKPGEQAKLEDITLLPIVKDMLFQHVRPQMT